MGGSVAKGLQTHGRDKGVLMSQRDSPEGWLVVGGHLAGPCLQILAPQVPQLTA